MNKTLFLDKDTSGKTPNGERRQEDRFPVHNRGEIKIIDKAGRLLAEEVTLEDWSDEGCRFVAGIALKAGDIVAVKPVKTLDKALTDQQPQLFEIVWTNRRIAFWVAGAIKLKGEKLAKVKFPPAKYASAEPSK